MELNRGVHGVYTTRFRVDTWLTERLKQKEKKTKNKKETMELVKILGRTIVPPSTMGLEVEIP